MSINIAKEIRLTYVLFAVTLMTTAFLGYSLAHDAASAFAHGGTGALPEVSVFAAAVLFLIYGNVVYQWCRLAYYRRLRAHRPAGRDEIERVVDGGDPPSLAILVPSYKEEPRVVLQTLLSAAFTEYPNKSVVLLIDDPPLASSAEDTDRRDETRRLVRLLQSEFASAAAQFRAELTACAAAFDAGTTPALEHVAKQYEAAAAMVARLAREALSESAGPVPAHIERFFTDRILEPVVQRHLDTARRLRAHAARVECPEPALLERYRAGLEMFANVRFSMFERKQYANLSHEPNKAMNLNTYIGLMGKSWTSVERAGGRHLMEATPGDAEISIPAADYLITLDADSMLLSDYALRLVHIMEQPEHARLAIAQTPYSAFPGAPHVLERIAGATTDLQYIVHQGFTDDEATFWVGANALIRRRALEDIKQTRVERGHLVSVYIQDRTLIEDTESSIDLVHAGWSLHNYPERLAYSATPPDFGALLIQRRRWANGGLLILGKLLRYAWDAPKSLQLARELALRGHYLASLAGGSAATLLLFFYPFDDAYDSIWLPCSALPYFLLYARDLRLVGYRAADLGRVYALNLVLLPVIVGGVLKSVWQGITGSKIPFGRTPKVASRSVTPPLYAAIQLLLPAAFVCACVWDAANGRWSRAAFGFFNAALFTYGLVWLLGVRDTVSDVAGGWNRILPSRSFMRGVRDEALPDDAAVGGGE